MLPKLSPLWGSPAAGGGWKDYASHIYTGQIERGDDYRVALSHLFPGLQRGQPGGARVPPRRAHHLCTIRREDENPSRQPLTWSRILRLQRPPGARRSGASCSLRPRGFSSWWWNWASSPRRRKNPLTCRMRGALPSAEAPASHLADAGLGLHVTLPARMGPSSSAPWISIPLRSATSRKESRWGTGVPSGRPSWRSSFGSSMSSAFLSLAFCPPRRCRKRKGSLW